MNERLKILRKKIGLTQTDFGIKIGLTTSAVSDIERGKVKTITESNIKLICREFNINEHWLRTGEGPMFEELTESQKAMKYTAMLLKDADSTVAKAITAFIITYEQLDDTNKELLEKIGKKYIENIKKSQ